MENSQQPSSNIQPNLDSVYVSRAIFNQTLESLRNTTREMTAITYELENLIIEVELT